VTAEATHLLLAAVLALSFALLWLRRPATLRGVAQAQSGLAALALGLQGWASGAAGSWGLAVVVLATGGVAAPWALRRHPPAPEPAPHRGWVVAAAALVVLAVLAVPPGPRHEDLGLALGCVLVALAVLAARHTGRPALFGLWALGNAVAAMAALRAMPLDAALLTDRLALHMAGLTTLVAVLAAPRGRRAMSAVLLAALLLALLADSLLLAWLGLAATLALLVVALRRDGEAAAGRRLAVLGGAGAALALAGELLLAAPADPSLMAAGFALLLLGGGTLAGLVPLHGAMTGLPDGLPSAFGGLLAAAALVALRRVLAGHAALGAPLLGLGLLTLLLAALAARRQADARQALAMAWHGQLGVVAFAFGLGGEAATFAGLLHLTLLLLTRAALALDAGRAARIAGLAALAGLPPFGLFASSFLIVTATARQAPLLAVPLLLGLGLSAWALAARIAELRPAPSSAAAGPGDVVALLLLATGAGLGLAMPAPAVAWFTGMAQALR
jgi:hydrogenase-4 component F